MIPWHRLFGITLTDFFTDTAYTVDLEKDLSLKQQLLDIVIIEKGKGKPPSEFPDGLEDIGPHNLMTYKSHQQSMDAWALEELMGHYVNYRKSIEHEPDRLPPPEDFRLFAVAARYPTKLGSEVIFKKVKDGVYDVRWGVRNIRIIVLSRISKEKKNGIWHLFSAVPETVASGVTGYQWKSPASSVINELFKAYKIEGIIAMPYTLEDYQRDYVRQYIDRLSPEEILEKVSAEKLMKELSRDELLNLIKKKFAEADREEIIHLLEKLKSEDL